MRHKFDCARLVLLGSISFALCLAQLAGRSLASLPAVDNSCAALLTNASLKKLLPHTAITSASVVSGTFTPDGAGPQGEEGQGARGFQGLPAFCRVNATSKPTPVSDIKIEVWLPMEGWNKKIEGVGNGGLGGVVSYAALASAIKQGFASVSTDDGHAISDQSWLPMAEKEKDYAYRAIHEMTLTAKAITQQFYGAPAKYSYFSGCSAGGSEALAEMQMFPQDYDGEVAGDPVNAPADLRAVIIWQWQALHKEEESNLSDQTLSMVTKAVLTECGGKYGIEDGFLEDPQACNFDPQELVCKAGQDSSTCLTAEQAIAVKQIYEGPHTANLQWPGLMAGSEMPEGTGALGWKNESLNRPRPDSKGIQYYSLGIYQNSYFADDVAAVDAGAALQESDKKFPFLNHVSTDINGYMNRRPGKLLMYHGWDDPDISPRNSINYYGAIKEVLKKGKHLEDTAALKELQKSVRLFMVPGMGHCGSGPGPSTFDAVTALDRWVDQGEAPDKIIASHQVNGVATYTRPLCPYPQEAQYTGSGDRTDASNWACTDRPFKADLTFYKAHNKN